MYKQYYCIVQCLYLIAVSTRCPIAVLSMMYHPIAIVIKSVTTISHEYSSSTRVVAMVDARLKSAEDTFNNKSRLDEVTATLVSTMQQSQDALRSLNRPIGPTLADAQSMMSAVQVDFLFRS